MAATKIVVPDFQFSGFYYAEILRRVRIFNRVNAPEITSEIAEEPFIQGERAFSLVGHMNNVLLDFAANELLLPTAKLQDSVRALLELIDYQIRDYSPSTVEVLAKLDEVLTSSVEVVEANSIFETDRDDENESVPFEVDDAVTAGPTNVVDAAFGLELDREGTDGATVVGDSDAFESASMAVSSLDIGKEIEVVGSVLGNNDVFRIAEVLQSGVLSRVRLEGTLGGPVPLFVIEGDLTWRIRAYTSNGAAAVNATGSPYFTPIASMNIGDKIYVGSEHVLWSELAMTFNALQGSNPGVWEYYDPDTSDENPDAVTNQGTYLTFNLETLLGRGPLTYNERSGSMVRVTHLPSGISELVESYWGGPDNLADTSAFLGQSGTPSTDPEDYSVATDWIPLPDEDDGTGNMNGQSGTLGYSLPQTLRRNWSKVEVNSIDGFYLRWRCVGVGAPTVVPVINTLDISEGDQYLLLDATQGETVLNEPEVTSSGQPNQEFVLSTTPGLRDTVECFVDEGGGEVEWTNLTEVGERLLTAGPKDRVFVVKQDSAGELTAKFGNGEQGKVPPLGIENIRFVYRVNAVLDGNVGGATIVLNTAGASLIEELTNPRPASGWREADGASDDSLALVKEEGPASLRTGASASAPSDYETLALAFTTTRGTRPVVRAKAIEEGFGPKTIKLVVVGTDGVSITESVRDELQEYFNGNESTGLEGVAAANTEVTVVNFTPRVFGVSLSIEANSALSETLVKTSLATLINPTALATDGQTWLWKFGGRVPTSRMQSEVFQISPGNVFDVDVSIPSEDVELTEDELPLLDSGDVTVSIVAPS